MKSLNTIEPISLLGMMKEKDETQVVTSFLTAILQILLLVMIYVLFQSNVAFSAPFYVAIFFVSLMVSAGVYYLTTNKIDAIILYTFAFATTTILITIFFSQPLGVSPTVNDIGLLMLMSMLSAALSSWISMNIFTTSRSGAGILSVFKNEQKRRVIKRQT